MASAYWQQARQPPSLLRSGAVSWRPSSSATDDIDDANMFASRRRHVYASPSAPSSGLSLSPPSSIRSSSSSSSSIPPSSRRSGRMILKSPRDNGGSGTSADVEDISYDKWLPHNRPNRHTTAASSSNIRLWEDRLSSSSSDANGSHDDTRSNGEQHQR